jgi:hypothetical protein
METKEARRLIERHDYRLDELVKELPPLRDHGDGEESEGLLLFRGRYAGDERMGVPSDHTTRLYILRLKRDGDSYVTEGW